KKAINLTATIPEAKRLVMADPDLIKRVLENLLNNAIKFSPTNGYVSMEVEYPVETNTVKVYVRDLGSGVKDELKQSIFQKYEIGQRFEGIAQTGLGLAFCKMVIDAHQGSLSITDNQPQGAIFTLELNVELQSVFPA
ncbi:sensor histidine kinase, partial [Planktothrix sp.]|uniref:sensor histidine kinase n=1 Tax=Planktothrix sp. TaxID=3088171 RepID=UPI0038D4FDEE